MRFRKLTTKLFTILLLIKMVLVDSSPASTIELAESYRARLSHPDDIQSYDKFIGFISKYHRSYDNATEFSHRFNVFKETLKEIQVQQKDYPSASFGINQFSDLTSDEFAAKYNINVPLSDFESSQANQSTVGSGTRVGAAPEAYDWRDYQAVTPVKDQGTCNCCYAFCTVAAVESLNLIQTGARFILSEQEIISCSVVEPYRNGGCKYGSVEKSLDYIRDKGVGYEDEYRYESGSTGVADVCQEGKTRVSYINNYEIVSKNENQIAAKLYEAGPLIAHFDTRPLKNYIGGIYNSPAPPGGWQVNHNALLVGYGEENGIKYWVVKNSWGADFGEQGYYRIARGVNCLDITRLVIAVHL